MTENSTKEIGTFLELIGKALQSENPTNDEVEVVFDSIKKAPEQFKELYSDCIDGTFIKNLADAGNLLRKMIVESNIDHEKFNKILAHNSGLK